MEENIGLNLGIDVAVDTAKNYKQLWGYGKAKLLVVQPTLEELTNHGFDISEIEYFTEMNTKYRHSTFNKETSLFTMNPQIEKESETTYPPSRVVTIRCIIELSDEEKTKKLLVFKFHNDMFAGFITKKKEAMQRFVTLSGKVFTMKVDASDESVSDFYFNTQGEKDFQKPIKDRQATYPLPLEANSYTFGFDGFVSFVKSLLRVDSSQNAVMPIDFILLKSNKSEAEFNKFIKDLFSTYEKLSKDMVDPNTFNIAYAATYSNQDGFVRTKPLLFGPSYKEGIEVDMLNAVFAYNKNQFKPSPEGVVPTVSSKGWYIDIELFRKTKGFYPLDDITVIEKFAETSTSTSNNNNNTQRQDINSNANSGRIILNADEI